MDINRITALILCFFLVLSGVCVYGDESQPAAGAVQNVEIQESFDINSGFYEQKLADGLEFFSSLPNGATVNDFVYFDVPMGLMNVAAERDGVSIKFENKTLFTQKGYYILKFSAVTVDGNALTGVFTFRIGDKPIGAVKTSEYLYPVVKCIANIVSDESGMYRYCLPNYKAFVTNVPEYGANVENARFIIPKNLGYSLKKDGKNISFVNNRIYSDPGSYSLRIFGSSYGNSMGYEAYYETVLDFTVGDVDLSEDIAGAISDFSSATDLSSVSAVSSYVEPFINSDTSSDINISTGTPLDNLIGSILMGDDNEETSDIPESIQEEPEILPEADIINDTLIETYFENASLFSETFSSGAAFYTNTPNDGIVGGNVYLDIPSDMSVEMSKDGSPASFENKTYINDEGSYSLLITVKDGEDILSARYTFRIQDGTDVSPQVEEESSDDTYDYFNEEDFSDGGDMLGSYDFDSDDVEYDIENSYDSEKMMFAFEEGNSVFYLSVPDGMATNEDVTTDVPKDLKLVLKKDGEEIPIEKTISGDGHYEISLSDKKMFPLI